MFSVTTSSAHQNHQRNNIFWWRNAMNVNIPPPLLYVYQRETQGSSMLRGTSSLSIYTYNYIYICIYVCYRMLMLINVNVTVNVTSCHVIASYAMPCHVMSCHAMSCHAMPCHVMSCHVYIYITVCSGRNEARWFQESWPVCARLACGTHLPNATRSTSWVCPKMESGW